MLLGKNDFPEPGANLQYDIAAFAAVDEVESPFEEIGTIAPDVAEPRALAIGPMGVYLAGRDVVTVFDENDAEIARFEIEGRPNCLAVSPEGEIFAGMEREVQVIGAPKKEGPSVEESAESSLGTSSSGVQRPNDFPCP